MFLYMHQIQLYLITGEEERKRKGALATVAGNIAPYTLRPHKDGHITLVIRQRLAPFFQFSLLVLHAQTVTDQPLFMRKK